MSKFAFAAVGAGLALIASTSAFASQQGGPDLANAIHKDGVAASWNRTAVANTGNAIFIEPTVTAEALTGAASDPVSVIHVGRLAYYVGRPETAADPSQSAGINAFNRRLVD